MHNLIRGTLILLAFATTEPVFSLELPVQDSNFKQCLEELAAEHRWDSPEQFTEVVCHDKGIASVEGIDHFQNLSKLSLYKNDLADLTIAGLKQLEHLNIAKNSLKSVKLDGLARLSELYLFNNDLRELTLENMPMLNQLKANSNKLTSVTFSHLDTLEKLYLFDNELEYLDIKTTPALRYLDVRHNPMPDEFYDQLDAQSGLTALHDGNSEDW